MKTLVEVATGRWRAETHLGVGDTTVVPRLGVGLVLAVAVAASGTTTHLYLQNSKNQRSAFRPPKQPSETQIPPRKPSRHAIPRSQQPTQPSSHPSPKTSSEPPIPHPPSIQPKSPQSSLQTTQNDASQPSRVTQNSRKAYSHSLAVGRGGEISEGVPDAAHRDGFISVCTALVLND